MNGPRPPAIKHDVRVRLLGALSAGEPLDLAVLAERAEESLQSVEYHCGVLEAEGAVTLARGSASITDRGMELHRLAQVPDRRGGDRRHGERRCE